METPVQPVRTTTRLPLVHDTELGLQRGLCEELYLRVYGGLQGSNGILHLPSYGAGECSGR